MVLNIYGPSGSGKTTLIKELVKTNKIKLFYDLLMNNKISMDEDYFNVSLSLIPLPIFRGSIKDFFDCYGLDIYSLLEANDKLKNLSLSIFDFKGKNDIDSFSKRFLESLSAGEMRRLFIVKSLISKASIVIIDEPFSNSDSRLFEIIIDAIKNSPRCIVLSHLPIIEKVDLKSGDLMINIDLAREKVLQL